jgi:hypothetical protein
VTDRAATARNYLERLADAGVPVTPAAAGEPDIVALQARQVAAGSSGDLPADADAAWVRELVQRAYGLPVAAPQRALMPTLLPLRRQHMTARALHRGFFRQLLGMFVYRPAARLLRVFQVLTGRVERT